MAEETVFHPIEIADNPFPGDSGDMGTLASQPGSGTVTAEKIPDNPFPQKRVAVELISVTLNTKTKKILAEYKFTQSGAIQIGEILAGVSGDIRISPDGIVARDSAGNTTFALDGTSGDAVFKGTLQAGTLIAGDSNVIIGHGSSGGRILLYVSGIPSILIGDPS